MFTDLAEHLAETFGADVWALTEEHAHAKREAQRRYIRDWYRQRRGSLPTRPCGECRQLFTAPKHYKYCSKRCLYRVKNRRYWATHERKPRVKALHANTTCKHCGGPVQQRARGPGQPRRYCRKQCAYRAAKQRARCKSNH